MLAPLDKTQPGYKRAMLLIVMFGLISLFSDLVYQAGRSLNGPLLNVLGADAVLVGFIAGVAEFLGYALRLLTGTLVDRTKSYWGFTIAGYAMVAAVPLMMLAGTWQVAALFIVIERASKAVRAPAKDTLLSMAAKRVGTGRGFAIHKVMDQTGAILGPLVMSLVLSGTLGNAFQGLVSYQQAYALLWIPLVLVLLAAFLGQRAVPHPEKLEEELAADASASTLALATPETLTRTFWIYSLFTLLVGIGFVNFTLLSFHAVKAHLLTDAAVPFWYAIAMAANAVAAYVVGTLYDRFGLKVLFAVPVLSIPLPLLGFLGGTTPLLVAAIVLFGFSLGIQETILKAGIADLTPLKKRGTGYGIFNTVNGVGLLASGALMGLLYDVSVVALCAVSITAEVAALSVLYFLLRQGKKFPAAR
ncbi:MAG: MFS transporter [Spirochaetales bacterium]